jgi:hypothetical protein
MRGLNDILNYLHVGWWLSSHGFEGGVRVASRYDLFDLIAAEVGSERLLYLEFGVHEGVSMRYWSKLITTRDSHLHGFDSFLGLPHDWSYAGHPRGYFSTEGVPPLFDDPRVRLFVGWFDETLPNYDWPEHDQLVVMLDADLYSSTATVLGLIKERLALGAYLYFDQFHHRADELRAFAEFLDEHAMTFRLVGASKELTNVLFQRIS